MSSSHLNSAQARAQAMKEDLKNLNLDHLQSFLEGISDPEPPHYTKVDGRVWPTLRKVTLREGANTYHVGNVMFVDENTIHNVDLVVEHAEVEAYMHDALPKDLNNPLTQPIIDAILVDLIPLFDVKFKAIKERMFLINDVRAYAHNAPNSPEQRFKYGKNLTKMIEGSPGSDGSPISRKRSIGEPVPKHPANKRKRIGLASIPDAVKSDFFARIPDQFKIELFNSIAKSAFPNFDNLLMAAWNVVSVYEHVGSEFGQLHTSITDLKTVLQEFDATYRKERLAEREVKMELKHSEKEEEAVEAADSSPQETIPVTENAEATAATVNPPDTPLFEPQAMDESPGEIPAMTVPHSSPTSLETVATDIQPISSPTPKPRKAPNSGSRESSTSKDEASADERKKKSRVARMRQLHETDAIDELASEVARKEAYVSHIKSIRGKMAQLKSRSASSQGERKGTHQYSSTSATGEQRHPGQSNAFRTKPNERNGRHKENDRGDTGSANPQRSGPGRVIDLSTDGTVEHTGSNDPKMLPPPTPIFLGNSKLGRPKTASTQNGMAPEAPMVHTGHNNKKDANGFKDV